VGLRPLPDRPPDRAMIPLLLIPAIWLAILALVVGLCIAAKRGDRERPAAEASAQGAESAKVSVSRSASPRALSISASSS
jgi:hypothetical protein